MTTASNPDTCPDCGSTYVNVSADDELLCNDCGAYLREATQEELMLAHELDAELAADRILEQQELSDFAHDDDYSPYGNEDEL
jgi:transcription initiation factor TFIIIB Brf1 subunit/transcription initiation factor TFIIB